MPDTPSRLTAFLAELRRRRVFRVAVVYAGVAFIVIQIIDGAFDYLKIPEWVGSLIIIMLAVGFPIAVGMAWAFDLTAEGLVRTRDSKRLQPKKPPRPVIGNKTVAVIAVLAVIAAAWSWWGRPGPEAALGAKSIAVLPFVNLSDLKEDEYFSDGITDEILMHLYKVGDLRVTSRTSTMQYKGTDKTIREIGAELGVSAILEGQVYRIGNEVKIRSQLIDARTDEHLWAEAYDGDLSDIFAIQSDVAQKIAAALKATLTPEEKRYIEEKPTDNPEAYEYYLRGNALLYVSWNSMNALDMFEKALELDPKFTVAYARLTQAHLMLYWRDLGGYNHTKERLAKAKRSLDLALALDPDHPEVNLAYGYYYYWGFRDYEPALEHFNLALKKQPSNSDIILAIGFIKRRQGQWQAAAASIRKATELDPRSWKKSLNLSRTYLYMRNWAEAERFADRCIFIAPESAQGYNRKANVYLRSKGDIEKARSVMEAALKNVDPSPLASWRSDIEILAWDYQKALAIVEADTADRFLRKADIYRYLGRPERAAAYFASARVQYDELIRNDPDYYTAHGNLGRAYAGLGRREDAIREGKLAVEILPLSRDALEGPPRIMDLAIIYTMLGEQDVAIDQLELLLSIPSSLSVPVLKFHPLYDPLREHPRFKALVAE